MLYTFNNKQELLNYLRNCSDKAKAQLSRDPPKIAEQLALRESYVFLHVANIIENSNVDVSYAHD